MIVRMLRSLGVRGRFGAIGQSGSIAIIERLWRTLKEMLELQFLPPLSRAHLEERMGLGLMYYAYLRPHQGLDGAMPAEVYFGGRPVRQSPGRNGAGAIRAVILWNCRSRSFISIASAGCRS